MKIHILTYISSHRKTYDTLCLLKALGYSEVIVYAKAFSYTKNFTPIIPHRPDMGIFPLELTTDNICQRFDYSYNEITDYNDIKKPEGSLFLVCGAGLIPSDFIQKYNCINSHPGYIPVVRGLDALKWAIYENLPIGVSTHIIGDEIDAGEIIDRKLVPIYQSDSFHKVAQRQYEIEISMLVDSLNNLNQTHQYFSGDDFSIHKRMPNYVEKDLFQSFEKYKTIHAIRIQN